MSARKLLIYAVLLIGGVAGALWVANRSDNSALHDYTAQNAERKRQRAEGVELSERDFTRYVEYAFLFSVMEPEEGRFRVGFRAGVCLAAERVKAGQPIAAWTELVAKATVDMVAGAQMSTATSDAAAMTFVDPSEEGGLTIRPPSGSRHHA